MMIDTDVLIWYFRGNTHAKKTIDEIQNPVLSGITLMELIQGMRNKQELRILHQFIREHAFHIYYLDEKIHLHAMHLLESYALGHGMSWGDALIAATAIYFGEILLTGHVKHYRFIKNMEVKKFMV